MLFEYKKHRTLIWRLIPMFICLIWISNYAVRNFILSGNFTSNLIIYFTYKKYNISIEMFAAVYVLAWLLILPLRHYIHATNFWLWGLLIIVNGGMIDAMVMHLISFVLFYRQGFFRFKIQIKLLVGILSLLAAFVSQIRFGWPVFVENTAEAVGFAFIISITVLFVSKEWFFMHEQHKEMILYLSPEIFTGKDVQILEKILSGEKYDTIARETGLAPSTLKKHIHKIFIKLKVSCRTSFMSLYANHRIILKNQDKA